MKIIILGAGPSGLSAFLALRKHFPSTPSCTLDVRIWEVSHSPSTTGGGLGLAPNGLRAFSKLSPSITTFIAEHGFEHAGITFYNSTGRRLGTMKNGTRQRYGHEQTMVARNTVQQALLEDAGEGAVVWGRRCVGVMEVEGGVELRYNDGSGGVEGGSETADLVLGCDGLGSVVRGACVDGCDAVYQGLTNTGGFLPVPSLPPGLQTSLSTNPVVMVFGPDGFFGYSLCTADRQQLQWWSTWASANPPTRDTPLSEIRDSLLSRHGSWTLPHPDANDAIKSIIDVACGPGPYTTPAVDNGVLVLPIHALPRLLRWGCESGRILLLGDAAHAVPPDSGQGVSLAVEDAVTLALLLRHNGGQQLQTLRQDFEKLRMPRVHKILDFAEKMGDQKRVLKRWQEVMRDVGMWVLCRVPEGWVCDGKYKYQCEKEVEGYLRGRRPAGSREEEEEENRVGAA